MDTRRAIIKISNKELNPSIYNYINMKGIRQFLVHHPKLLLLFEILVNHIDDYLNHRVPKDLKTVSYTHLRAHETS